MAVYILCLFLAVPWVVLQCVIVVFPGHTQTLTLWSFAITLSFPDGTINVSEYYVSSVCAV